MLYVFVCLSDKCIGTQKAVRVFRCIVKQDNELFSTSEELDEIYSKTDNQLRGLGYDIKKILNTQEEEKKDEEDEEDEDDEDQIDS